MEIESVTEVKAGHFAAAWNCLQALPCNLKAKVVSIAKSVTKLGRDDPRLIFHSLKVGIAITVVSLLYYTSPTYKSFGVDAIWAVLTVVLVFEFTAGATISKGINRGIATLLAGASGVGAQHLASLFGDKGEPVVLGLIVFLVAATFSFARFIPWIKTNCDYGLLIFILTFSLISVSGYRINELMELARERLSTIVIGGAACIVVSLCVFPIWAGEELHNLVASNIDKLARYLEGFGGEYFQSSEDAEGIVVSKEDKSFLSGYKSVLNTKTTEESFANFARWEPRHGRFRSRYPWQQYLKIGALARQCAYQIDTLNCYINSDNVQVPLKFQTEIQESCTRMSAESGKVLTELASSLKTMSAPSSAIVHVENSKTAIEEVKAALENATVKIADQLAIIQASSVASILIEIVKSVEKICQTVHELSKQANFKKVDATVSPEKPQLLHREGITHVLDHVVIALHE